MVSKVFLLLVVLTVWIGVADSLEEGGCDGWFCRGDLPPPGLGKGLQENEEIGVEEILADLFENDG